MQGVAVKGALNCWLRQVWGLGQAWIPLGGLHIYKQTEGQIDRQTGKQAGRQARWAR